MCQLATHAPLPSNRRAMALRGAGLLLIFPATCLLKSFLMRDLIPICPFRIITGRPCPFCGMTRAFALATRGQWRSAWTMNPLWPLAAIIVLACGLLQLSDAWTGKQMTRKFLAPLARHWRLIAAFLVAFGTWRIIWGR